MDWIRLTQAVARHPDKRLAAPVDFHLAQGEHIAIVGGNASGKSRLVDMITGKSPLVSGESRWAEGMDSIRCLSFRDMYGAADSNLNSYYQLRWNMGDQGELDTVAQGLSHACDKALLDRLIDLFGFGPLYDKPVLYLSSGELRKFQLMRALLSRPKVLVLDNPNIGLDAKARGQLEELLSKLAREWCVSFVLVTPLLDEVPPMIDSVYYLEEGVCSPKMSRSDYMARLPLPAPSGACLPDASRLESLNLSSEPLGAESIVETEALELRYGSRTILHQLSWKVGEGEKWALLGENGAGKSALLSLVCADNPQAYACPIRLFGRKRGSGESIWDIKRHIGYVSPEMHRSYMKDCPAVDIVASGLHDSVGLYLRPKPEERVRCLDWMRVFGIERLAERSFLSLSTGEQRLCLLARAFVKDPRLLILDEPLHGLDTWRRERVVGVIEAFCRRPGKTLVISTHYPAELPACVGKQLILDKQFRYIQHR